MIKIRTLQMDFKHKLIISFLFIFPFVQIASFGESTNLDISGKAQTKISMLNTDFSIMHNETALDLKLKWYTDSAFLFGNLQFLVGQDLSPEINAKELYLGWYGDFFDIKLGKQKVLWGKADGFFISDIVSPKNLSQFLTTEMDDLRLAILGIKIDAFLESHKMELVWAPVFTPSLLPNKDSIWAPSSNLANLNMPLELKINEPKLPVDKIEHSEIYARYSWLGSLADIQVVGAWFWNDTPVMSAVIIPPLPGGTIAVTPEYYQVGLVGLAGSIPFGPFIFRGEAAYTFNQRYFVVPKPAQKSWIEKDNITYLVAADISFFEFNLSLQWSQDWILDFVGQIDRDEFENHLSVLLNRKFFRETFTVELFSNIFLNDPSAMIKPQLTYSPGNGFELSAGAWFFVGSEGQFGQYKDNSAVFISAAYYF